MPFNFQQEDDFGSGLAKGATQGLQNFVMPAVEDRQKSKLALQMMNAKIDAEQQARIAEQQSEAGIQSQQFQAHQAAATIPQDEMTDMQNQFGGVLKAIQNHSPIPVLDASNIKTPQGQAAYLKQFGDLSQGLSMAGRYDKPVVHTVTDPITGKQTFVAVDPFTGSPTWTGEGGTAAATAKSLAVGRAAYFKLNSMADEKEKEISSFANSSTPLSAALQQGQLTLAQLVNTNPDAKAVLDQLPFAGMQLERSYLGGLPRSQQMQGSGSNYLFNLNDTVTPPGGVPNPNGGPNIIGSFNLKMQNMRRLGFSAARDAYSTAGRLPDADIVDPDQTQAPAQGQPKLSASGFAQWQAQRDAMKNAPKPQGN